MNRIPFGDIVDFGADTLIIEVTTPFYSRFF